MSYTQEDKSEVLWTYPETRDFNDFVTRVIPHCQKFKNDGINIGPNIIQLDYKMYLEDDSTYFNINAPENVACDIYYTTDGSSPDLAKSKYNKSLKLTQNQKMKYAAFRDSIRISPIFETEFIKHKAVGKNIELISVPDKKYNSGGKSALTNGVRGSEIRYKDNEWLGFLNSDFECSIDFGYPQYFDKFQTRFYNSPGVGIYTPSTIEIYGFNENNKEIMIGGAIIEDYENSNIFDVILPMISKEKFRYLKIKIKNSDVGDKNGKYNWLFVDELIIR